MPTHPTPHGQVPEALEDFEVRKLAAIGAVHTLSGLVERRPIEYRRELEDQFVRGFRAAEKRLSALSAAPARDERVPEAWTNLLAYVLQDDLHNRLTPRVIDIAYTAFNLAKQPNIEDGGSSDWLTDTKPTVDKMIAKLRKDLIEDRGASPTPPAEQQAAYKAAPEVGNSGFDYKTAADFLNGKTVSDEAVRKFVAASRRAHDEKAALSATLLAMHGVLTSREAEIALLKKALLEAEAAPQQEAQEPCGWTTGITWRPDTRLQSEQVIKITRDTQPKYGYTTPIYTAPQPAPAPLIDGVVKDAARWHMAVLIGNELMLRPEKRTHATAAKAYMDATHSGSDLTGAVDAAIAAQGGKDA